MKRVFIALVILVAAVPASGQESFYWRPGLGQAPVLSPPSPRYLTISCGKSSVSINLENGEVDVRDGCDIDDAARAFWTALGSRMPKECKQ